MENLPAIHSPLTLALSPERGRGEVRRRIQPISAGAPDFSIDLFKELTT
jgi:hypothetical protein